MAAFKRTELDLVGLARQDNQAAIQLFVIRDGAMVGRDVFLLDAVREAPDEEVLSSFLEQFYARATSIPRQVLVPFRCRRGPTSRRSCRAGAADRSTCSVPQRGEKRELMVLATRNAAETLAREQARWLADQGKTLAALEELAEALGLPGPPLRIECYDISNVQGSDSVGSMVVFEEGRPRHGRVPPVQDPDGRRGERLRLAPGGAAATVPAGAERGRGRPRTLRWAMPDLVIIDGGKGQVSAAKEVLDELGLARPAAGRPRQGARGAVPAGRDPTRSSCRRRRPRCTSSSGCATRPTASRSRTTATCARSARPAPRSTTCRASARSAGGRCCGSSARRSGSARRRSSRSRRCRASAPRWRPGSRSPWAPEPLGARRISPHGRVGRIEHGTGDIPPEIGDFCPLAEPGRRNSCQNAAQPVALARRAGRRFVA